MENMFGIEYCKPEVVLLQDTGIGVSESAARTCYDSFSNSENDVIKYKRNDVGKIMVNKPYSFALIKVVEPDLKEFTNTELICGKSKVKILKPEWI